MSLTPLNLGHFHEGQIESALTQHGKQVRPRVYDERHLNTRMRNLEFRNRRTDVSPAHGSMKAQTNTTVRCGFALVHATQQIFVFESIKRNDVSTSSPVDVIVVEWPRTKSWAPSSFQSAFICAVMAGCDMNISRAAFDRLYSRQHSRSIAMRNKSTKTPPLAVTLNLPHCRSERRVLTTPSTTKAHSLEGGKRMGLAA